MRELISAKLKDKEFWGHPAGLYVLFFTEMWERFSFYGMRALLILYMTQYLLFDPVKAHSVLGYAGLENFLKSVFGEMNTQQISSQIYGLYTGFVYFTPFFGGMLADRILGQRKTVYLGGILMAIGHFLMASEQMFLVALLFLILGNGCFKPNISTQVGSLYKENDPRRDGAFTIFYMGINLGAFFSPLVCGTLGQKIGWHWGFGAAGVGMVIGLLIYHFGSPLLPKDEMHLLTVSAAEQKRKLTYSEWRCVGAIILLCFLNIMFWAIYEQQGNTLQLWADERTNWNVFGLWEMPSTWYQAFNPAFIFIFAPIMVALWSRMARWGWETSSVTKMGIGCVLCGLAYIVMIIAAKVVPEGEKGSLFWLVSTTWIFTMGELYLSPTGLSLVTKLAPKPILSMMMGVWFLSSFFGNYMTGYLGSFYSVMMKDQFFAVLAVMGVATGIVFFLLKNSLNRAIGRFA